MRKFTFLRNSKAYLGHKRQSFLIAGVKDRFSFKFEVAWFECFSGMCRICYSRAFTFNFNIVIYGFLFGFVDILKNLTVSFCHVVEVLGEIFDLQVIINGLEEDSFKYQLEKMNKRMILITWLSTWSS